MRKSITHFSRREVLIRGAAAIAAAGLPLPAAAGQPKPASALAPRKQIRGETHMNRRRFSRRSAYAAELSGLGHVW